MKKVTTILWAFLCILFTSQEMEAQNILFEETFAEGLGKFIVEGNNGYNDKIWSHEGDYAKADAYGEIGASTKLETFLVSPAITLNNTNKVSFENSKQWFNKFEEQVSLVIRTIGGEWVALNITNFPDNDNVLVSTGDIIIPDEFNGKEVQFGFKYTSPGSQSSGIWKIKNFVVEYSAPSTTFEETFAESLGEFVIEGNNGYNDKIWSHEGDYAKADAYGEIGASTKLETFLVSPAITLLSSNNKVSFENSKQWFNKFEEQVGLLIRTIGGEWVTLNITNFPDNDNVFVSTGDIIIPDEFNGKEVQFGFKYTSPGSQSSGIWKIKNFVVNKPSIEKKEAELSYPEAEYTYLLGNDKFIEPELINPNNLKVEYTTSNKNIADVDSNTGDVTIHSAGTVIITAQFAGNEEFNEGSASYTIVIKEVPTNIENAIEFKLQDNKVYNIQGLRVNKLTRGIYIINGKKTVFK